MEKMSALKPATRIPRTTQTAETMTTLKPDQASLTPAAAGEGKDLPTASTDVVRKDVPPPHPQGHKCRDIAEVWKTMDSQPFLHLSDTLTLADLWVQPLSVEPSTTTTTTVTFLEILASPYMHMRKASTKVSVDDLLQMLYLNDCIQADAQGIVRLDFPEWLSEKTSLFVKAKGVENATNRSRLADFIIKEDKEFGFYPEKCVKNCGVFFRKICYHEYTNVKGVISNPSMILRSSAPRGKFEYILEARIFPLPDNWWIYVEECTKEENKSEEVPETQPMDL